MSNKFAHEFSSKELSSERIYRLLLKHSDEKRAQTSLTYTKPRRSFAAHAQ